MSQESSIPQQESKLSVVKQELLKKRLRGDSKSVSKKQLIPQRSEQTTASLSFAQERLWLMNQLQTDNLYYNVPTALRLNGILNIGALQQSLNEIVQRHEVLRTSFLTVQEQPVQKIASQRDLALPVIDLQALLEPQQQLEVLRLTLEEAKQLFNLAQGPLLRTKLLQLDSQKYIFLLTMHHIISDAWSTGVLIRELSKLYQAFCDGKASPLSPLSIQYADFAVWQRQWLQGEVLENQLHYWKQQLNGASPLLELPGDRPRPATQTYRGATQSFVLPADLFKTLQQLSRQENVTLFMSVLAAFKVLLYRYTGEDDIIVGSPIAARNRREIEELIGFFINSLVLRTDLSGNPSFRQLLGRVREVTLGAYAHQDLPFEKLVEELQPERDLSYNPLFQVVFDLRNIPMPTLELPNLTIELLEVDLGTVTCDLELHCQENSKGFEGILVYNTDLFDAATITQMLENFQTLLKDIVTHPDKSISDLSLLNPHQKQLLVEWNKTQTQYPQDQCIHQLFQAQVEKTPDAVALFFEQQQLSYGELNARANQLAHHLQALGVGPEVLVGLCVERSLEMVIGVLGILKAGGAYVPLDPTYPQERLAFMLEDSQVPILLTQQQLVEELPTFWTQIICLDADWEIIENNSKDNLIHKVDPENLAYIIYTSGSTGKPKGVQIQHQSLCNLSKAQIQTFNVEPHSCVLQFASLSFDASVWEIVMAVCSGAKLCLSKADTLLPGKGLLELLEQQAITHMTLPPSVLATLPIEELQTSTRAIIVAGEACSLDLAQRVAKGNRFFNGYGPTETTVCATIAHGINNYHKLTIGRAIANAQVYILDEHLQSVPIGVPGELYIGGVPLARGYFNQPQLTAEKFIPHPLCQQAGARLYKTGDQARYLGDGEIEFLGRIDQQVKIRGFRIELGEIEAVLAQHPHIQQVVVIVREDQPGNQRLIAYIITNQESPPSISNLRQFLQQQLPEYMLPSAFMFLEALPLTSNGKVNCKALPVPDLVRVDSQVVSIAPCTPTEIILAGLYAQVLGVEQVGKHDNFFELGGHSLLGTKLISQVAEVFQVELSLRSLFEAPTIAGLSNYIETARRENQSQQILRIKPVSRDGKLPLSFAQQRLWFLDKLKKQNSPYNIPAALKLVGMVNVKTFKQSLNEIVRRHETLRTTFTIVDSEPIQVIAPTLILMLPIIDLCELPETERNVTIKQLVHQEAKRPFDLNTDTLIRTTLLKLGNTEHILLLTMHHIISDGWSVGILVRELTALYEAFSLGKSSPLPELPIQYADFAVCQRQWLQGEILEGHLSYWKQQLGHNLSTLQLPTDYPRPEVQTFRGATQFVMLPKALCESLKSLSHQEGVTLFMTLLTSFKILLHYYTAQDDIVVGTDIANRNQPEIEGLIGFFVNQLVLRTDLSGNPTFLELLGRVREVTLQGYSHQDLPFNRLVKALKPERDMSRNPLFQVMFNLLNTPIPNLKLLGLNISPVEIDSSTSVFDLSLNITDTEQELIGGLRYNTDLFNTATITKLIRHFEIILRHIVANPLTELKMLEEILAEADSQERLIKQQNFRETLRNKLKNLKPKPISESN
ncbi:non-ribosomal peptide synthetase [Nostocales cyanobacterium HT-58-2]|nr:non-ribosomal peptide synthetase [Nostocales cyanobacterium HT-58-2]